MFSSWPSNLIVPLLRKNVYIFKCIHAITYNINHYIMSRTDKTLEYRISSKYTFCNRERDVVLTDNR